MSTTIRNPRLGKGLAALMGELEPAMPAGATTRMADIDLLEPSPYQPRVSMPEENLLELAESIKAQGILQPILVREHPTVPGRYQIIAGERRWRAAALAGLHEVPIYIRGMTDQEAAAAALVENLQRQDLNAMEEAEGLKRLIDEFGFTHEAMGKAIAKSRSHISNVLRLLNLPVEVQMAVRDGRLSYAHARTLLRHPNPAAVLDKVVSRGMSVLQIEAMIDRELAPRPPRKHRTPDPNLRSLETDLADLLGLRVRILVGPDGRGQVIINVENWLQIQDIRERLSGG